ncbi:hypothetical protein JHU04_004254 [Brenneria sp. 4F2]|nr:hypothetical protein [Brenneria bubanii]
MADYPLQINLRLNKNPAARNRHGNGFSGQNSSLASQDFVSNGIHISASQADYKDNFGKSMAVCYRSTHDNYSNIISDENIPNKRSV